ncbi:dihydroorotase, homodimeric type [Tribonema minus]|uniref:Dihydroorotase, mitochondrial n=1 Tax=Tribonema minus TaxID=303371 RepID=A0A835ZAN4_9STRA|nr:dihydroorotase, homodimeric type [Tribonema minus]
MAAAATSRLTIAVADDFHHHFRDGDVLQHTVPHAARMFRRAIAMPNLKPPVTTTAEALAYRDRILACVPPGVEFEPLMTLYLTDHTDAEEIHQARKSGHVHAVKLYPAGATTNSDSGVTDLAKVYPVLEAMAEVGMPLLVHGEVTASHVDIFDKEARFVEEVLGPLVARFPNLKVVAEHITTKEAAEFVLSSGPNVAATITPQHLLYNRNEIFRGGVRPHMYCLPILKREEHRLALVGAATSGSAKIFLGTDSAPHARGAKESACGCAGIFSGHAALELYAEVFDAAGALDSFGAFCSQRGADFYGLPRNAATVTLAREPWRVPASYAFGASEVVPLRAGEHVAWQIADEGRRPPAAE